jgi:hypothetical protein
VAVYRDGLKIPTELWEAAMMHHHLKVQCCVPGCGNSAVYHAAALWLLFARRGWEQPLRLAEKRFWCRPCTRAVGWKVKRARLGTTRDALTVTSLPLPSDAMWKKFASRHRG